MTAETRIEVGQVGLVLASPLALLINLLVSFVLTPWACIYHWKAALITVHLAFLLIALAAGWLSLSNWRRRGSGWPGEEPSPRTRIQFLAAIGVIISAISALQIAGSLATAFIVGACQ
jgi:hypothetical protein